MASKNVMLSQDAYERLQKHKRDSSESFSKVVLRLVPEKPSILDFIGTISHEEAEQMRRDVAELRKSFKVREWPS